MILTVSRLCRHCRRCTIPLVLSDVFFVAKEFTGHVNFTPLFCIHHVAAIESFVAKLELRVIGFAIKPFLLFCCYLVLRKPTRSVGAWESVDVRGECFIQGVTLLSSDVIILTCFCLDLLPSLDTIQAC